MLEYLCVDFSGSASNGVVVQRLTLSNHHDQLISIVSLFYWFIILQAADCGAETGNWTMRDLPLRGTAFSNGMQQPMKQDWTVLLSILDCPQRPHEQYFVLHCNRLHSETHRIGEVLASSNLNQERLVWQECIGFQLHCPCAHVFHCVSIQNRNEITQSLVSHDEHSSK